MSCGIVALAVPVVVPLGLVLSLQGIAKGIRAHPVHALWIAVRVWVLAQALLNAFIISGVIGSLKREDWRVTVESFLKASVSYFEPIAGLFFVMALVSFAFNATRILPHGFSSKTHLPTDAFVALQMPLTVITLLLMMLIPFAVVARNLGMWQGVKCGIRDWVLNAGSAISFIALGITFLVPVLVFESALSRVIDRITGWHGWTMPVYPAINIMLAAVMLLAVWEFYRLLTKEGAVEQPEA